MYKKFQQSRWRNSILVVPLLIASWFMYGSLLGAEIFDIYLPQFRILFNLEEIFGYLGVLFAIQIPVFILLLEKMHSSGYVRRLVLPSVIQFREILISYVVLSLLLLLSPSQSFFYLPVLGLTALSLYTIFEAVRVLFEGRKLKSKEDDYIRKLVKRVLEGSLKGRISLNKFFESIKELPYVTHGLIDYERRDKNESKRYPLRISRAGIVDNIDIDRMNDLMSNEYDRKITSVRNGKAKGIQPIIQKARLILLVRPGAVIHSRDEVAKLVLPSESNTPSKRFTNSLLECMKVTYDHPDSVDRQLDDVIKDFKQQLRSAIDKDDLVAIDDALDVYSLLTSGLATLQFSNDPGYTFATARNEFHPFYGDSVSDRLQLIADVIDDEFFHAVRGERQEVVTQLISSMYKSLIHVTNEFDILTVARSEQAFTSAITKLIYSDETTLSNTKYRNSVVDALTFRLKEHTGLLLYYLREYDQSRLFTQEQLEQWLEARLNDARGFMLGAYKKSYFQMFKSVKRILDEVERDYDLYPGLMEGAVWKVRSSLLLVSSYMHDNKKETDEQKKAKENLDKYFSKFSAQELTKVLVECIDNDYADKWRIDTYDLVADGKMRAVPDFKIKLKALWADYMLKLNKIPSDLEDYHGIPFAKTGTFSDELSNTSTAFLLTYLEKQPKSDNVTELKGLVEKFISERKQWEDEELANAILDKEMVAKFKNEVINSYRKSSLAFSLFYPTNHLNFVSKAPKGFLSYGWNQIQDKYGFIKGWHIGVGHPTDEYGRQIARAENRHVLEVLLANPKQIKDFESWIKKIRRIKNKQWFIVSVSVGEWYIRYHMPEVAKQLEGVESSREDIIFKGVNQLGGAYYTYLDTLPKGLYAVLVDEVGTLSIKATSDEPVTVSIDAYSHDALLLKSTIKSPPVWLIEKGDTEKQTTFLKTVVRMFVQHPFRYEPPKHSNVYFYPVNDKDAD